FRRDVAEHQPARAAAEATIGDERDGFAQALSDQRRGHAEHLAHAGSAARAFVADHDHVAGLDLPVAHRRERVFFAFEPGRRPARCRSTAGTSPPGLREASSGVRALPLSKSSSWRGIPASRASESKCSTALVDPPVAATPAIELSNDARVTMLRGRTSRFSRSTTSLPISRVASSLRGSVAGMLPYPTGPRPSNSVAIAMVLAVNWPPHAPAPGQAT